MYNAKDHSSNSLLSINIHFRFLFIVRNLELTKLDLFAGLFQCQVCSFIHKICRLSQFLIPNPLTKWHLRERGFWPCWSWGIFVPLSSWSWSFAWRSLSLSCIMSLFLSLFMCLFLCLFNFMQVYNLIRNRRLLCFSFSSLSLPSYVLASFPYFQFLMLRFFFKFLNSSFPLQLTLS